MFESPAMKSRMPLRFLAVLALTGLAALSCKKDARQDESTPPAVTKPPADVLAIVSLPDGLQLSELAKVLGAVDPNAGQAVGMLSAQAGPALESMLGEIKLDTKAAAQVIVLNPKKHPMPAVIIGKLSGKGTGDMELRTIGKVSVAGSKAGIDAVASFIPSLGEAKRLRAVLFPKHIVEAFKSELETAPKMMAALGGADALGPLLEMYVEFVVSLADNADTVEMLLDHSVGRGTLRVLMRSRKGSTLAKFAKAQSKNDFKLMERLPATKGMLFDSNVVAGPAKDKLLEVTDRFLGTFKGIPEDKQKAYSKHLREVADLLTGELAGSMEMTGLMSMQPAMKGVYLARLSGKGNAKSSVDGMFEAWAGGTGIEIGGTKQSMSFQKDSGEHAGVKYSTQTSKVEMGGLGEPYEQTSYLAVIDDKDLVMVMGDEGTLKSTIDTLKAGTKSAPPANIKRAIDLAKKRNASSIMVMDMSTMLGGIPGAPKMPVMSFVFAFDGANMDMYMDFFRAK